MTSKPNIVKDLGETKEYLSVYSEGYELRDTGYVIDQLDFMEKVGVTYPDGTIMVWEMEASERYEELVKSFGDVDEHLKHFNDGSIAVFVEQGDEPLFALYGEERDGYDLSEFGFTNVLDSLSG